MGYGVVARGFHWITVLLVFTMIPVGLIMTQDLPRTIQDPLFVLHKGLGPFVLLLVALRLVWRAFNPPPPLPGSVPDLQRRIAGAVHFALYGLLLIMGISGYVRVTAGGFPIESLNALGIPPLLAKDEPLAKIAASVHSLAAFGLIALIITHVTASAYHAILQKDGVLRRMWPPFST